MFRFNKISAVLPLIPHPAGASGTLPPGHAAAAYMTQKSRRTACARSIVVLLSAGSVMSCAPAHACRLAGPLCLSVVRSS